MLYRSKGYKSKSLKVNRINLGGVNGWLDKSIITFEPAMSSNPIPSSVSDVNRAVRATKLSSIDNEYVLFVSLTFFSYTSLSFISNSTEYSFPVSGFSPFQLPTPGPMLVVKAIWYWSLACFTSSTLILIFYSLLDDVLEKVGRVRILIRAPDSSDRLKAIAGAAG